MTTLRNFRLERIELLAILALATQVFFFEPVKFYLSQFYNFNLAIWQPFVFAALIAAGAVVILYVVVGMLSGKLRELAVGLIAGLALWAWVKSSVMIWNYPVFEGAPVVWSMFKREGRADIVVLALCILVPLVFPKLLRRSLPLLFRVSVAASIIYIVYEVVAMSQHYSPEVLTGVASMREVPRSTQLISTQKNVVLIVIDTVQADLFEELLDRDPAVRSRLEGFTWFHDAASMSPITGTSVPTILTGQFDENNVPFLQYLHNAFKQPDGLLRMYGSHGYHRELIRWGMATPVPSEAGIADNQVATIIPESSEVSRLLIITGYGLLPQFLKTIALKPAADLALDEQLHGEADSNRNFADQARELPVATTDKPVLKIFHMKGIHIPLEPDEFKGHPAESPTYNRENVNHVMEWLFGELTPFLDQLKANGQYDNSVIVITGDHGAGRMNISLDTHLLDEHDPAVAAAKMQAAASPLLLIHAPQAKGPLVYNDAPVSLGDVPCTLEKLSLDANLPCKGAFDWHAGDVRTRRFYWHDSLHVTPFGYLLPIRAYSITGPVKDANSWSFSGNDLTASGVEPEQRPLYRFGNDVVFGKHTISAGYLEFGWRPAIESHFTWTDGHLAKLSMPTTRTDGAVRLDLTVQPAIEPGGPQSQRLGLVVNGLSLGQTVLTKTETITKILPPGVLKDGSFSMLLATPDSEDPVTLGRGAGDMAIGVAVYNLRLTQLPTVSLHSTTAFGAGLPTTRLLLDGWKPPEKGFVWSAAPSSSLLLPLPSGTNGWRVGLSVFPLLAPGQRDTQKIDVSVNGRHLAEWDVRAGGIQTVDIPFSAAPDGLATLTLRYADTRSPQTLGLFADNTPLAIQLASATATALP